MQVKSIADCSKGSILQYFQTWGELIDYANALIMHYFFPLIQGND